MQQGGCGHHLLIDGVEGNRVVGIWLPVDDVGHEHRDGDVEGAGVVESGSSEKEDCDGGEGLGELTSFARCSVGGDEVSACIASGDEETGRCEDEDGGEDVSKFEGTGDCDCNLMFLTCIFTIIVIIVRIISKRTIRSCRIS